MIFVRHHENCSGRPSADGKLTGECDCKVAPMDDAARKVLEAMIAALESNSIAVGEDREYLALRLDMLADVLEHAAHMVRRRAARDKRGKRGAS